VQNTLWYMRWCAWPDVSLRFQAYVVLLLLVHTSPCIDVVRIFGAGCTFTVVVKARSGKKCLTYESLSFPSSLLLPDTLTTFLFFSRHVLTFMLHFQHANWYKLSLKFSSSPFCLLAFVGAPGPSTPLPMHMSHCSVFY